jgi:predicted RNA-binding Zn-ribbon protein involved in translation (DUF1610 family)
MMPTINPTKMQKFNEKVKILTENFKFKEDVDPTSGQVKGFKIFGKIITPDKPTRNKVSYSRESLNATIGTLIGKPFLDSHKDESIRMYPPFGHVVNSYMAADGAYYEADIDPMEETFIRKVKRGDIKGVSLQVLVSNVEPKEGFVRAHVQEFLELSPVLIPGDGDSSIKIAEKFGLGIKEANPLLDLTKADDTIYQCTNCNYSGKADEFGVPFQNRCPRCGQSGKELENPQVPLEPSELRKGEMRLKEITGAEWRRTDKNKRRSWVAEADLDDPSIAESEWDELDSDIRMRLGRVRSTESLKEQKDVTNVQDVTSPRVSKPYENISTKKWSVTLDKKYEMSFDSEEAAQAFYDAFTTYMKKSPTRTGEEPTKTRTFPEQWVKCTRCFTEMRLKEAKVKVIPVSGADSIIEVEDPSGGFHYVSTKGKDKGKSGKEVVDATGMGVEQKGATPGFSMTDCISRMGKEPGVKEPGAVCRYMYDEWKAGKIKNPFPEKVKEYVKCPRCLNEMLLKETNQISGAGNNLPKPIKEQEVKCDECERKAGEPRSGYICYGCRTGGKSEDVKGTHAFDVGDKVKTKDGKTGEVTRRITTEKGEKEGEAYLVKVGDKEAEYYWEEDLVKTESFKEAGTGDKTSSKSPASGGKEGTPDKWQPNPRKKIDYESPSDAEGKDLEDRVNLPKKTEPMDYTKGPKVSDYPPERRGYTNACPRCGSKKIARGEEDEEGSHFKCLNDGTIWHVRDSIAYISYAPKQESFKEYMAKFVCPRCGSFETMWEEKGYTCKVCEFKGKKFIEVPVTTEEEVADLKARVIKEDEGGAGVRACPKDGTEMIKMVGEEGTEPILKCPKCGYEEGAEPIKEVNIDPYADKQDKRLPEKLYKLKVKCLECKTQNYIDNFPVKQVGNKKQLYCPNCQKENLKIKTMEV